jgi:hypothetical protein
VGEAKYQDAEYELLLLPFYLSLLSLEYKSHFSVGDRPCFQGSGKK